MKHTLPVATYLAYSPRGVSETSKQSRDLCMVIKNMRQNRFDACFAHIANDIMANGVFADVLGDDPILVPVPRSAPLQPGALWPGLEIATRLHDGGVGSGVQTLVTRHDAVTKSATAGRGNRPTPGIHAASMRVNASLAVQGTVVLVDDVLTIGATMIGCAIALHAAMPWLTVRGFAAIRTMGLQPEIDEIIDPKVCRVSGDTHWSTRVDG